MRTVLMTIALVLLGSPARAGDKVEKLIKDLDSLSKDKRLAAMKELGNLGTAGKGAVDALAKQMRHKDAELANGAARALAQIGPPAVAEVIAALDEPAAAVRNRALLALGTMGRDAGPGVVTVSRFLKHEEADVRLLAALVLGALHEEAKPAGPALEAALRDSDPRVRFVAADSLFQIGADGLPHLLTALKHNDPAIRYNALAVLGRYAGSEEALQALLAALQDDSVRIRALAAESLIRLGQYANRAVPRLFEILADEDREVQVKAFTALLTVAAGDPAVRDALTAANEKGRWAPGSSTVNAKAVPVLKKLLLADAPPTQRLTTVLALAQLGASAKDVLPLIKKLATADRDRVIRAAAVLAVPAIEAKHKPDLDKAADLIGEALDKQDGTEDPGPLIRAHILLSVLPSMNVGKDAPAAVKARLEEAAKQVRSRLEVWRFTIQDVGGLVDAINHSAHFELGFTEPLNQLAWQIRRLVAARKDSEMGLYLYKELGNGVSVSSLYLPPLQELWVSALANAPLDKLIVQRQQTLGQRANAAQVALWALQARFG